MRLIVGSANTYAKDRIMNNTNVLLHCSFCGRHEKEVAVIIAGPAVYICDECIYQCLMVIFETGKERHIKSNIDRQAIFKEYWPV